MSPTKIFSEVTFTEFLNLITLATESSLERP